MKFSRKHIIFLFVIFITALFLVTYDLPYYIYKPGHTAELENIVSVDPRFDSEGKMQLVTVSGAQASPMDYLWAKLLKYHELVPINEARPKGITDEEYMYRQLHLMESSQHASTVVAYNAANKKVDIQYAGVHVMSLVKKMPAAEVLHIGDIIVSVDDKPIKEASELTSYVETKSAGETITLEIKRDNDTLIKDIQLTSFPDEPEKIGVGIQLVTERLIDVTPSIEFDSGKIGGPSAGLMFALEIYNQLTEKDISKGYNIVGTGEVDFEGNVLRIGGIDKKVIAAHKSKCDVFFVPNENGADDSNYNVAKQVANDIQSNMKIVPIDHFSDALNYLQQLEEK